MKLIIVISMLLAYVCLNSNSCEAARILGVFPLSARSHFMIHEALMKGLAKRGHQVDIVSTFPQKKPYPNYTDLIDLKLPILVNNLTYTEVCLWRAMLLDDVAIKFGNDLCKSLDHPKMLQLIRNPPRDPPYDLVITETLTAHCFMALGHHLKVPVIGVSSAVLYPWLNGMIANPANLAFAPNNFMHYSAPLSFWRRVHNTVLAGIMITHVHYLTRVQDDMIRDHFGPDAPGVREAENSIALILTNSYHALNGPKPTATALIEVGGLHVQDDETQLPKDIVKWMDESTDGFVYFTFGSMIKIETFPEETIKTFYRSLEKIAPIRVLIKIVEPGKLPPGLPKNFRTFKWISQYKVLKHKNIKAFITHGGLMGTQEAIHCAVPMIGIPLFADQFPNINLYEAKKLAVKLDYDDITDEKMDWALNEILYNPLYKNSMVDLSTRYRDRPMSPMDTATWWVEYVIRHGGESLRSPAMDLTWWQIELLDVYAFLIVVVLVVIYLTFVLVRFIFKIVFKKAGGKVTNEKKIK